MKTLEGPSFLKEPPHFNKGPDSSHCPRGRGGKGPSYITAGIGHSSRHLLPSLAAPRITRGTVRTPGARAWAPENPMSLVGGPGAGHEKFQGTLTSIRLRSTALYTMQGRSQDHCLSFSRHLGTFRLTTRFIGSRSEQARPMVQARRGHEVTLMPSTAPPPTAHKSQDGHSLPTEQHTVMGSIRLQ